MCFCFSGFTLYTYLFVTINYFEFEFTFCGWKAKNHSWWKHLVYCEPLLFTTYISESPYGPFGGSNIWFPSKTFMHNYACVESKIHVMLFHWEILGFFPFNHCHAQYEGLIRFTITFNTWYIEVYAILWHLNDYAHFWNVFVTMGDGWSWGQSLLDPRHLKKSRVSCKSI